MSDTGLSSYIKGTRNSSLPPVLRRCMYDTTTCGKISTSRNTKQGGQRIKEGGKAATSAAADCNRCWVHLVTGVVGVGITLCHIYVSAWRDSQRASAQRASGKQPTEHERERRRAEIRPKDISSRLLTTDKQQPSHKLCSRVVYQVNVIISSTCSVCWERHECLYVLTSHKRGLFEQVKHAKKNYQQVQPTATRIVR